MLNGRVFTLVSLSVLVAFAAFTGLSAVREGRQTREFIRDYELPSLGLAVTASLDRTAAEYRRLGEELLRYGFLRDWILAGEQDEDALRAFLEEVRARFDLLDASIVSDRTETYYGTDGRTLTLSRENLERDGWYYLYRESLRETNIDAWYYPETGRIGMWVNVPVLDEEGAFLGVTGGGVDATEFSEMLHSYGGLPGINVYLARRDGQLVYGTKPGLLESFAGIRDLWDLALPEPDLPADLDAIVLEPAGAGGPMLWVRYSPSWNTFVVVEKTEDALAERMRGTIRRSLLGGGFLALSLFGITMAVILAARKCINRQTRELETLAGTDGLTGLCNRLRFTELVEREIRRVQRTGEASCLLILDLDHFKTINDNYGHPAGDEVLRKVARILKKQVRQTDTVARFGGEEFTVLLPGTTVDGACSVAEKIRTAVEEYAFTEPLQKLELTVSIGVAALDTGESTLQGAYRAADKALYSAKSNGRNRVERSA